MRYFIEIGYDLRTFLFGFSFGILGADCIGFSINLGPFIISFIKATWNIKGASRMWKCFEIKLN